MVIILAPVYTLRVEITDRGPASSNLASANYVSGAHFGDHQFFGGLDGDTGCDRALKAVRSALEKAGIRNARVSLERFECK